MSMPEALMIDQIETQSEEAPHVQEEDEEEEEHRRNAEPSDNELESEQPEKKKRVRKEPVALVREAGKSLLPFSKVQKIIKADKDIPIIAKDATFLISLATEEFIKRLCEAGKRVAEREKRSTVQHKDIATVVRRADEFMFLEEIIPWVAADPPARRKPQGTGGIVGAPTLLDQFIVIPKKKEDADVAEQPDIVMNEDGTMGGGDSDDEFE